VDKSALKRPTTLDFLCASDFDDMRMARATIAGDRKGFVAACLAHDRAGHRDFKRGRVREACGLLAGGAADPEAACRRLEPLFSNPLPEGFCAGELRQFAGDEAHCRTISGQPDSRALCLGYAAWRRARAGDASACAASPVCRVLDGAGPEACAPYAARALAGVCAAHYAPRALARAERALDEAGRLLARAEPASGPETRDRAEAVDRVSEEIARLRLRARGLRPRAGKTP
jgi:hypothetical protein